MAALPDLITVEQFRQLPDSGEYSYELHHGEVIATRRPKAGQLRQQVQLLDLLRPKLAGFGRVAMEFPYRPIPEFELRAADVALISHERWNATDPEDNLRGAPELVIDLASPSHTSVALCLATGALECWLIDRLRKSVSVVHKDGTTSVYEGDTAIPLTAFGSNSLGLAEISE